MSKTQAALQRRLGRLSMLIDLAEQQLPNDVELVASMKKELSLIKEISLRLVELPRQHDPSQDSEDGSSPKARGRR